MSFCIRYLVLEKLKKEDAQRIHVFSSFFYKRLNQRERRNVPDTTNLPWVSTGCGCITLSSDEFDTSSFNLWFWISRIQKRKHNRVKTWTRHVDLFQKDFIFVPINESWVSRFMIFFFIDLWTWLLLFHFSPVNCLNSRLVRAHWYLAVICFPGLKGPVYEQNPLCPFPASTSAADPPSENMPDHCRPLSPDRDGLDSSSDDPSPGVPEAPTEGQPNGDLAKENSAFTEAGHEPSNTSAVSGNGQADGEQQYTSESRRFSLQRPFYFHSLERLISTLSFSLWIFHVMFSA